MSKYNRTYHLFFSPGATNDDRMSKSVDTLLGIDIVITEKLDGENCGMTDHGVYARSHAAFTISPWSREVRALHKLSVEDELGEGVYLFGENMEVFILLNILILHHTSIFLVLEIIIFGFLGKKLKSIHTY